MARVCRVVEGDDRRSRGIVAILAGVFAAGLMMLAVEVFVFRPYSASLAAADKPFVIEIKCVKCGEEMKFEAGGAKG